MPRLQILVHKSYHPYLEKNKQRVREDEARAALEEAEIESRRLDEEAESRLDVLRARQDGGDSSGGEVTGAGAFMGSEATLSSTTEPTEPTSKLLLSHRRERARQEDSTPSLSSRERTNRNRLEFDWPDVERRKEEKAAERLRGRSEGERRERGESGLGADQNGHINFWAGMEKDDTRLPGTSLRHSAERPKTATEIQDDDPTTMYLHRPERETQPWYTDRDLRRYEERERKGAHEDEVAQRKRERKRRREEISKISEDPFTQVQAALKSTSSSRSQSHPFRKPPIHAPSYFPTRPHASSHVQSHTDPTSTSTSSSAQSLLISARLSRESSERTRALALIEEQRRIRLGNTPSSASSFAAGGWGGGGAPSEYGDQFDARAVRAAKEARHGHGHGNGNGHKNSYRNEYRDETRRRGDRYGYGDGYVRGDTYVDQDINGYGSRDGGVSSSDWKNKSKDVSGWAREVGTRRWDEDIDQVVETDTKRGETESFRKRRRSLSPARRESSHRSG